MLGVAQVKVRIKIENANARCGGLHAQVIGQPAETGEGDFMPAPQPQRQMPLGQQLSDLRGVSVLCAFEVAAHTGHVPGVIQRRAAVPGQIGQRRAQGRWPKTRARAPLIAFDAFITGQTNERRARRHIRQQRLDPLMPAQGALPFGGVNTACPQGHVRYNGHAKTPITFNPGERLSAARRPASNGSGAHCVAGHERLGP